MKQILAYIAIIIVIILAWVFGYGIPLVPLIATIILIPVLLLTYRADYRIGYQPVPLTIVKGKKRSNYLTTPIHLNNCQLEYTSSNLKRFISPTQGHRKLYGFVSGLFSHVHWNSVRISVKHIYTENGYITEFFFYVYDRGERKTQLIYDCLNTTIESITTRLYWDEHNNICCNLIPNNDINRAVTASMPVSFISNMGWQLLPYMEGTRKADRDLSLNLRRLY